MTFVRDPNSQLIGQFPVPYKGTWLGVAANQLSPDALYDSLNVFIREGKLRERPGLLLVNSTVFENPVIGGAMAVTPTDKILLAITKDKLYTLNSTDTEWQIDTELTFAAANDGIVDITFLETSSEYVAIIAEKGRPLKKWVQGAGAEVITAVAGANPQAKSICSVGRRIVYLVEPHTVGWTSIFTYDNFPALAINRLAQTNDLGIAVKPLSSLAFAVYKERSIYIARAQAGSDAGAFAFSEPIIVEGPAGVHAIVDLNGAHLYMTRNGRVGLFDATKRVQWIADGIWLFLQTDIDPTYAHRIFGVFDLRIHTVVFYYPKNNTNGLMYGMVLINIPLEGSGIDMPTVFLGLSGKPCSFGYEVRFNNIIDRSVVFTESVADAQSFYFDENTKNDDGANFDCFIQTPLLPLPDSRHHKVSVEPFIERADGNGFVTVYPVTSDILESKTGLISDDGHIIDLNNNPVNQYIGFDIDTRFFGFTMEWTSESMVRYAGTSLYGRVTG